MAFSQCHTLGQVQSTSICLRLWARKHLLEPVGNGFSPGSRGRNLTGQKAGKELILARGYYEQEISLAVGPVLRGSSWVICEIINDVNEKARSVS